jgi:4-hydroxy-tetrahydrodipicolinate reductase
LAIPVVLMGLGAIGRGIARAALLKHELEIVAAIDLDPSRIGRKLSDVLDTPAPDVVIGDDAGIALKKGAAGVLLHATSSRLDRVEGELAQALSAGLSVVSTCEELSYPWLRHPEIAERLDRIAERRKVALLGTGVNPGFVLDRLPATLGSVCGRVDRVTCRRVVDSRTRRGQLQRKVGAGLNEEEFDRGVDEGAIGHVGLMESAALAALGVGLEVDEVDESIDPVEAEEDLAGEGDLRVPKGGICGVHQIARAFHDGKEVAHLELTIALGAKDPRDEIELEGEPGLKCVIPGGTPGDKATAWTVVHAAPLVRGAEPGLITVLDLPAGR